MLQGTAQEESFVVPDSLKGKSYDYLFQRLRENQKDTITSVLYANTYLAKAMEEDNGYRRMVAYRSLIYYAKEKEQKYVYIEKALGELESLDDANKLYLFIQIGIAYYDYDEYESALEYYLKALELSKNVEGYYGENTEYIIFNNVALIKLNLGKYYEALDLYKKNAAFEKRKNDTIRDIGTTASIAECMRYVKRLDSASYYYKIVVNRARTERPDMWTMLEVNEGINQYYKKNYKEAEGRLQKEYPLLYLGNVENQKYYVLAKVYLGKIQLEYYQDTEKAKEYFTQVVMDISKANIIIPETIEAYEFLINYHKEKGDTPKQLDVVSKLYELRTTMSDRSIATSDILHAEFDVPELLKSKEKLIKELEEETSLLNNRSTYLIAFVILLLILIVIQYNRHKRYKKRFDEIILELNAQNTQGITHKNVSLTPQLASILDESTVNDILEKLDSFETEKEFLQNGLNVATVAKKCDTNAKYLSKVINTYKNKSFVNYINDLRIDFILKELKENPILQKYTIQSISEEAGFNTAESFATAFRKKTGIRPSYYIRNLKKK